MDLLDAGLRLAFFLHKDREIAHSIVVAALPKVGIARERQDRRHYYRARKRRNKPELSDSQLFQALIYLESEPYERQREIAGRASAEDLLIWWIKHLVQVGLERNAFHVTVGITQLLYGYRTREAITLFDALVQDPDCRYDEDYYRARKSVLLREVRRRFGHRHTEHAAPRRGWRASTELVETVRRCLEMFTPWDTCCKERGSATPRCSLDAAEHREQRCLHTVLHPRCLQATTRALALDSPEERLSLFSFPPGLAASVLASR